jgi:hypothetical protein
MENLEKEMQRVQKDLLENSQALPEEFAEILNENFWDLIDSDDKGRDTIRGMFSL